MKTYKTNLHKKLGMRTYKNLVPQKNPMIRKEPTKSKIKC
jgi:hypothetical protein